MITATELRIGNKVLYDTGEGKEVCTIDATDLCSLEINTAFRENHYPIKISPAVLITCGFIKDNYGLFYKTKDGTNTSRSKIQYWIKRCKPEKAYVYDVCKGEDLDKLIHLVYIKYLHQLQNLYYILESEELNYTP